MIKRPRFGNITPIIILAASLLCSISLVVLLQLFDIQLSAWHVFLIAITLLPGILAIGLKNKISSNHINKFHRLFSWTTGTILLLSFFFILEPYTRFRTEIPHQVWLVWLPVVLQYGLLSLYWVVYLWVLQSTKKQRPKESNSREVFIDFARGFAILLAVGSHAFYAFGYDVLFGDVMYQVMSLTRFATPSFVLITGMMFEFVYLRKAEKQGFRATVNSLVMRALQCYGAYLITVFIEWFNQQLTTTEAINTSLFLGNSLFSGILKFYALFLLLAIPIIWLRKRFGIGAIVVIPIIVWLVDILLVRIVWLAKENPIAHLTALLFGHPALSNFSVWHSLTFMSFGMVVAYAFKTSKQAGNWRTFQVTLLALFVLCLGASLVSVLPMSGEDFFFNFSNVYRINHQIPYYSIGSMGAFLLLWITWKLRDFLRHPVWKHSVTTLGKDSLWAFAVGNSLAAVLPALSNKAWFVTLFTVAVLGGSVVVIKVKDLLIKRD